MRFKKFLLFLSLTAWAGLFFAGCGSKPHPSPTAAGRAGTATASPRIVSPYPSALPAEAELDPGLALGGSHTCALTLGGGVRCWGNNRYGQLGNGTLINSPFPADVSLLGNGVKAIAAGWAHTCALMSDGGVRCWGINSKGQLGTGTKTDSSTPVAVRGLEQGVAAITAGDRHTCALLIAGGVKCWGENTSGELGDGTTIDRNSPVDVAGLSADAVAVEAGGGYTCALVRDGSVRCWGWNANGQLGNGSAVNSREPAEVAGLAGPAQSVSAGDQHTCALLRAGGVECWGANDRGQLGDGTRIPSAKPVPVKSLLGDITAVSAGGSHTCALSSGGGALCWGGDQSGQLGDGQYANRSVPAGVTGLTSGVAALSAGFGDTCARMETGGIQCWGWNMEGQLGDGSAQVRRTPAAVIGFSADAQSVSIGWSGACALALGGRVWCWGDPGLSGSSGGGIAPPRSAAGLDGKYLAVTVGGSHACALNRAGGVKCWGANDRGQLGNGATGRFAPPVDVAGLASGVVAIAAGNLSTCALTMQGGVTCWGANEFGQLGNGTTADSAVPVAVKGLAQGVRELASGGGHACALTGEGRLKCWGSNKYGQLGDGTRDDRSTPVDVSGLTRDVNTVSAGEFHTCAIVTGVKLKCWGWNIYGQLGDSTETDRPTPADVLWLAGTPASVAAGYDFTCALMRAGNVRCWGNNEFGQLGDGANAQHDTPVDVQALGDKALSVGAGFYTACALTAGGEIKCWGNNLHGQLGNGTTASSSVPSVVAGVKGGS